MKVATQKLDRYEGSVQSYQRALANVHVKDDDSLLAAGEFVKGIREEIKSIEAERVELTKPLNDHVKMINDKARKLKDPLQNIIYAVNQQMQKYQDRVRLRKKRLEERKAKKLEEQGKPAEAAGRRAVAERTQNTVKGSRVQAIQTKRWTYKVTDYSKISRRYLCLDEKAIRAAIRAGVREIEGLEIYQEHKTTVR